MICPNCGADVGTDVFCSHCGTRMPEARAYPVNPPSYSDPQPAVQIYNVHSTRLEDLPPQYRPLSAWAYWGLSLLFSVPIVGFVFLIVFSCSGANINRRSFARSYFCWLIIAGIILTVILLTGGSLAFLGILSENLN